MRGESLVRRTKTLSEGQIYLVFDRVCQTNNRMISEGIIWEEDSLTAPKMSTWDKIKSKASDIGKNLTTKVTASKLASAWKSAGSPTDSTELSNFLTKQGVNPEVINKTYSDMKLQPPTAAAAPATQPTSSKPAAGAEQPTVTPPSNSANAAPVSSPDQPAGGAEQSAEPSAVSYAQVKAELAKLDKKNKQRLVAYLEKQLGTVQ
jgi:hypothetical protein